MKLAMTTGICMCLIGCQGLPDDAANDPAGGPSATTTAQEDTADTQSALAPKADVHLSAYPRQLAPFQSRFAEEPGLVHNVASSFNPAKSLALQAFQARLGVQR
jgi:hypothetical protein